MVSSMFHNKDVHTARTKAPLPFPSIHQHEAVVILRFGLIVEGFNEAAVVPGCLVDVDAAGLHGRPRLDPMETGVALRLAAFLAEPAGTGQKHQGLVIAVLEKIPFERNQHLQIFPDVFSPVGCPGHLQMK